MTVPTVRVAAVLAAIASLSLSVRCGAAEPAALFDGKSLEQWDVIGCEAIIDEGAIRLQSGNGLVQTKKKYGDFVFEFEWKTLQPDNWDSGVYFRYAEVPQGRPWPNQYQVNLRKGLEGELVGFEKGVSRVPVKAHEWNRFVLTVKGKTASLSVNGKPAWEVSGIKVPEGFIALQAEVPGGGQFLFRNIRVTETSH